MSVHTWLFSAYTLSIHDQSSHHLPRSQDWEQPSLLPQDSLAVFWDLIQLCFFASSALVGFRVKVTGFCNFILTRNETLHIFSQLWILGIRLSALFRDFWSSHNAFPEMFSILQWTQKSKSRIHALQQFLKAWSLGHKHQHPLGSCLKCKFLEYITFQSRCTELGY